MTPDCGDPVATLLSRDHFGIKLGLDNIRTLCDELGHPERAAPAVIVAGTNGKGSVTAFVSAALANAGFRTGRYTSPHLVRLEERFAIDGRAVATAPLAEALAAVLDAERRCRDDGRLPVAATFFELTTGAAFELFRRTGVEVMVLEVGLGGRFDATNVVEPVAGAITTVDLDHVAHLGGTIEQIAFEKAGVIKPGGIFVVGESKPGALAVIEGVAAAQGATIVHAEDGAKVSVALREGRTWATLETPVRAYGEVALALGGRHQARNALVAVRVLEALEARGWTVGRDAITRALVGADWPGRLQTVRLAGGKRLLLDAAHNPAGAAALASYLREAWPGRPPLVFGAMRDKDVDAMLGTLAPAVGRIVFTGPALARARPPAELLARLRALGLGNEGEVADTTPAALARALREADGAVVAGSIFLLGEMLAWLGSDPGRAWQA
jgi:dihydrofolate synthase/folylpolyglutamate synthase